MQTTAAAVTASRGIRLTIAQRKCVSECLQGVPRWNAAAEELPLRCASRRSVVGGIGDCSTVKITRKYS